MLIIAAMQMEGCKNAQYPLRSDEIAKRSHTGRLQKVFKYLFLHIRSIEYRRWWIRTINHFDWCWSNIISPKFNFLSNSSKIKENRLSGVKHCCSLWLNEVFINWVVAGGTCCCCWNVIFYTNNNCLSILAMPKLY